MLHKKNRKSFDLRFFYVFYLEKSW